MKSILIIFFAVLITSKILGQNHNSDLDTINVYSIDVYDKKDNWKDAKQVSMKELLKNPKKYHRKLVKVYGYVSIPKGEYQMIYDSIESFKNKNYKKAIMYAQFTEDTYIVKRKFNGGYAIVTGMFSLLDGAETNSMIYEIRRIDIPKVPSR
jgi:hypothetical protein